MTVAYLAAAWDVTLPPDQKLALITIADSTFDNGRCYADAAWLGRKCCLGDDEVRQVLEALERAGWLAPVSDDDGCWWQLLFEAAR